MKENSYLIISNEFLKELSSSSQFEGELWGVLLDEGSVVQLLHSEKKDSTKLSGYWLKSQPLPSNDTLPTSLENKLESGHLLAFMGQLDLTLYRVTDQRKLVPQPYHKLEIYASYYSRTTGLFDSELLKNKKVAVVGLGTGGSVIASELAKAGVGRFVLIDYDRLEVHNIARHICGLRDLGRYKTKAVRDYLFNVSLVMEVETYELDINQESGDSLSNILKDCDLIIGATDDEYAKEVLNQVAWKLKIPAVYGAAYSLGFGGDVFLAFPPHGACYACFRIATSDDFSNIVPENFKIKDYGTLVQGKIVPQPALGLDVHFISLIAARSAITTLLNRDELVMIPYPGNYIRWGNQPHPKFFERALESQFFYLESNVQCPVCHSAELLQATLKLSLEQAEIEAKKLLASIPKVEN